ncbi:MAG: winged helix-turn-helix domain-containing protein [Candidatus Woesearchaeota archaeon]
MEIESVFLDSKWKILNELSQKSLSPSELAEKTKTSLANISAQIRLLEALDFIEMEKINNIAKGEPRKLYSLKKEFSYLIIGTKFYVGKKMFKLDEKLMSIFLSLMINKKEISLALIKLILDLDFKLIEGLAYLDHKISEQNINESTIFILLIKSQEANFDYLNNNYILKVDNFNFKINAAICNKEEFQNNLNNENCIEKIKKSYILFDRGILNNLKKNL